MHVLSLGTFCMLSVAAAADPPDVIFLPVYRLNLNRGNPPLDNTVLLAWKTLNYVVRSGDPKAPPLPSWNLSNSASAIGAFAGSYFKLWDGIHIMANGRIARIDASTRSAASAVSGVLSLQNDTMCGVVAYICDRRTTPGVMNFAIRGSASGNYQSSAFIPGSPGGVFYTSSAGACNLVQTGSVVPTGFVADTRNTASGSGYQDFYAKVRTPLPSDYLGTLSDITYYQGYAYHWAADISLAGASLPSLPEPGASGSSSTSGHYELSIILQPETRYIAIDQNRDKVISFDDIDATTQVNPYEFWLNSDRDRPGVDSDYPSEQEDDDPTKGPDSALTKIPCRRDLEDFARLQLRLPDAIDPAASGWKCTLALESTDGLSVRVFPGTFGGHAIYEDPSVGNVQISAVPLWLFNGSNLGPIAIPSGRFNKASRLAPLIFEGVTPGTGSIHVRFFQGSKLIAEDRVFLKIRPITDFYDHYTVDNSDVDPAHPVLTTPVLVGQSAQVKPTGPGNILFVHGWNLPVWERKAFGETAFKRLWHAGYKGRFAMFSWPTEYGVTGLLSAVTDSQNFDRSEQKAFRSGLPLHNLLLALGKKYGTLPILIAHSMGNIAASEALRIEAGMITRAPNKLVDTYIAMQAATVASAYDAKFKLAGVFPFVDPYTNYPPTLLPYFGKLDLAANHLVNYLNPVDYALTKPYMWPANQALKPLYPDYHAPAIWGSSWSGFRKGIAPITSPLNILNGDRFEIFAFAAPANSPALGAGPGVAGPFDTSAEQDLSAFPFGFSSIRPDHSAQFLSDICTRHSFWDQVLLTAKLSN